MLRALDVATSYLASGLRFAAGTRVGALGPRPGAALELYEFEACPYCRKVREAVSALDLEAVIYPCPRGGTRFRPRARELGGREQFPYLVDPGAGVSMYESMNIVRHLYGTYGDGRLPLTLSMVPLATATGSLASVVRGAKGARVRASRRPAQPLELYSFESSPYCRIVREALCSMELPHLLHSVAKGSPRRAALVERSGKMQVPYLVDPNTSTSMFESADIVGYLGDTYGHHLGA
ncbi:MAG: glutathione S-transferase N-terminal domain-containing protein [Deltaproteobacteria bacterium]